MTVSALDMLTRRRKQAVDECPETESGQVSVALACWRGVPPIASHTAHSRYIVVAELWALTAYNGRCVLLRALSAV